MQQAYLLEEQERKRVKQMVERNHKMKVAAQQQMDGIVGPNHPGYEYEEKLNNNIQKFFSPRGDGQNTAEDSGEETEFTESLFGGNKQISQSYSKNPQNFP